MRRSCDVCCASCAYTWTRCCSCASALLMAVSCIEAGPDPRGHLWVTWGVYLCAGKPPLADIILSHPPGLT